MRARAGNLLPLVLMLFLALLTLWLQYTVQQEGAAEPGAKRHDPDAVVENFSIRGLDAKAGSQYTFSAAKMLHYADDDNSEVLYPKVVHVDPEGDVITATANRGTLSRNGDEAFLYGDVLVVRAATGDRPELRARTEFLHVLSGKEKIAETDRPVLITEGNSSLSGVGMRINKDTHEFILRSQVKGLYEAPKKG